MVECPHVDQISEVAAGTDGCQECLESGERWIHLRLCMACGHVGCCDDSKNKHATKHFHAMGHPVIVSFEPGEEWGYCFVDEVVLEGDWPINGPTHHSAAANAHVGF